MRYGFVIDHRKCIGCHACTVACKEENQVPLGAFRTWVKYVERGTYPDTRRYFAVLRCNHCDAAPCIAICPTVALYRRRDGIVDLDGDRCIGCKSCMQACPYDALYIDPGTRTAAKCHYCAHRVEVGLEPACVVVCPEQAIVAGDLDDPRSRIAQLAASEPVQVRKPEQGTRPKVLYVGADASALAPSLQAPAERYMWAQRPAEEVDLARMVRDVATDGAPGQGTLSRPVYDVPHARRPWGWKVSAYLWTKSVAAGTLLLAALAVLTGGAPDGPLVAVTSPLLALVFTALTAGLLVRDLKRPGRFFYVLIRPNPGSWLVLGAWVLMLYGAVAGAWLVAGWAGRADWLFALSVPVAFLAVATAGYSAFLFRQAEGRDFWQSPLLLPQLLVAAVVAGAASLLLAQAATGGPGTAALGGVLAAGLAAQVLVLVAELFGGHGGVDGVCAARLITRGRWSRPFWVLVVGAGTLLPIALLGLVPALAPVAAVLALVGLWVYEDVWLKAGQAVALS